MLKRAIAATEILLILPAAVFMAAMLVRNVTPLPNEPAETAQRIVLWYAHLPPQVGLWLLLSLMPLAVVVLGCAALVTNWSADAAFRRAVLDVVSACRTQFASVLIAGATLSAVGVLSFVAVHMLTD